MILIIGTRIGYTFKRKVQSRCYKSCYKLYYWSSPHVLFLPQNTHASTFSGYFDNRLILRRREMYSSSQCHEITRITKNASPYIPEHIVYVKFIFSLFDYCFHVGECCCKRIKDSSVQSVLRLWWKTKGCL